MSDLTVRYRVAFRTARRRSKKATAVEPAPPAAAQVSRSARLLALAYYMDSLVEDGTIVSYAEAARRIGMTRARLGQVMGLLDLSPAMQEAILPGRSDLSEHELRAFVHEPLWERQTRRDGSS